MSVKILADSSCDLPKHLIEKYDISIIPIYVIVDENRYSDGVDLTPEQLIEMVDGNKKQFHTCALNVDNYMSFFRQFNSDYDEVVFTGISSGMSSCFQNATIAAQELGNVYVTDSLSLSTGIGFQVLEAAAMAKEGRSGKEILETMAESAKRVEASFVINTLNYLFRGGRCTSLQKLGANLLNFKPSIEVTDGKMTVGKKYRGAYEAVILKYVEDRLAGRDDIDESRLFITHSPTPPEIIQSVREAIGKYRKFDEIIESDASCSITCHCGPCTLGIIYKRKA